MNPIIQGLSRSQNRYSFKELINMVNTMRNPQSFVNNLLNQNPEMKNLIQSCGTPRSAFYTLAKQMGVDPDEFINNAYKA
jgi:hypothetical protein